MTAIPEETVRNIAVCGHRASGKTTLVEHLLLAGGAITRAGSVTDGTTVSDFDPLEKDHGHSLDLSCCYLDTAGLRINLLDSPGYRDFIGRFYCATVAADMLLVVVSAEEGVQPTTRKFWEVADRMHLPRRPRAGGFPARAWPDPGAAQLELRRLRRA
jgi:elongation factor G